ncbi:MAG: hypothetical protein ACOCTT_01330 [archaeon]
MVQEEFKYEEIEPEKRVQEVDPKELTIQDMPDDPVKAQYRFTHSPLINEMHKQEIKENREIKNILGKKGKNMTSLFFKDLEWRMNNEKNFIIVVYGETGTGKSSIAQRIALEAYRYLPEDRKKDAELDESNIAFTRDQLLNRLQRASPGETMIYDEDKSESYGMGTQREHEQMKKIEESVRAESINFVFCSPDPKNHEQHYTIRAFDVDYNNKVNRAIIYYSEKDQWRRPIGTLYTKKCFYKGYLQKKRDYIHDIKKSRSSGKTISYIKAAKEVYNKNENFPYRSTDQSKLLLKLEFGDSRFTEKELNHIIHIAKLWKKGDQTPEGTLKKARQSSSLDHVVRKS